MLNAEYVYYSTPLKDALWSAAKFSLLGPHFMLLEAGHCYTP
jgi:hypothetical protein